MNSFMNGEIHLPQYAPHLSAQMGISPGTILNGYGLTLSIRPVKVSILL